MIEPSPTNDVLEKCTKDILSQIKPVEDDRKERESAIQELEISIQSVAALSGAAVKPFGSFLSNLYSKSGDLDLSVQLINSSNLPLNKKKKQTILRELRKALQKRDVARYMEFIPHARVPVLKYVSNRFGISCDLSVDNYPGRIKSRVFYWISTLDERFGDMVLLIKEWAKAQNINDPKTGTLNSYSLCLLVLFHFQTCEPAILPPLKDIYEGNITEDFEDMTLYDEERLDEVCAANIAKFESQSKEQRNESSLCHLLATFFNKFCDIGALSSDVISTYTGKIEKIKDNPSRRMKKSYSLFVEDPVERPDNAARAVGIRGLSLIASAFSDTHLKFVSLENSDRNDLLANLCTPAVCSKLGGRVIANSYTSTPQTTHQQARPMRRVGAKVSDNQRQRHQGARGSTGSKPAHNPTQVHTDTTGRQTPGQGAKGFTGSRSAHNPTQVHTDTTGRQTPGQGAKGFTGSKSVRNPTPPGQYRNQDAQFYTNTTGYNNTIGHHYQAPRQPELYQNHHHPPVYTPGHQTTGAYWNQSHPQGHTTWVQSGVPYPNHNYQPAYTPGQYAAGSYQYQSAARTNGAPVFRSGAQTPGPHPYQGQPQVHPTTFDHVPGAYQNGHYNQQMYTGGTGVYQSQPQRERQHKTDRHGSTSNNRNGVATRYEPVAGGLQNGLAPDSRSQASSSRTEWQRSSQHQT
ncbi:unnamed protein product [Alopecurus aequalis]